MSAQLSLLLAGVLALVVVGLWWRQRPARREIARLRAQVKNLQYLAQDLEDEKAQTSAAQAEQAELFRVTNLGDYANQLRFVEGADFVPKPLLNRGENYVFQAARVAVADLGHQVFAQVSMGEILKPGPGAPDSAYRSINSKRVDVLICAANGWPLMAIEHQGEGHYQGEAVMRDRVKRTALEKAGILFLETGPEHSDTQIISVIRKKFADNRVL